MNRFNWVLHTTSALPATLIAFLLFYNKLKVRATLRVNNPFKRPTKSQNIGISENTNASGDRHSLERFNYTNSTLCVTTM